MTGPESSENPETGDGDADDAARSDDSVVYRLQEGESGIEAVVRAVSTETRTDPLDLVPLYSVVDPEALNDLVRNRDEGNRAVDAISFGYCDRQVTVTTFGTIQLDPTW